MGKDKGGMMTDDAKRLCEMIGAITWWHMALDVNSWIAPCDKEHINQIVEQYYCEYLEHEAAGKGER